MVLRISTRLACLPVLALIAAVGITLFSPVAAATQVGDQVTEAPPISDFTKVQINGAGDATIIMGGEPSISITAGERIIEFLDVSVEDGTLTVGTLAATALEAIDEADIQYEIVATELDEIHLNGSINASADGVASEALTIGLTTFAELELTGLDTDSLTGKLDISSTAHVSGRAESQSIEVAVSSTYNASDLDSDAADMTVRELSEATVRVSGVLSGDVSTGGNLKYIGEDTQVDVETSTFGTVEQLPFTPLETEATPEPATAAAPMEVTVDIESFLFEPGSVEIAAGGTVTWINHDTIPHDIADLPDAERFHSPLLANEQSWSFTFTEPGTYDYYCPLHPIMFGQIIVK